MHQAFILGAGLGTRLQPLTHHLPKPLVPLYHRPLAEWAVSACLANGIQRIAINTHHLPEAWNSFPTDNQITSTLKGSNQIPAQVFPSATYELTLFHEPDLLETGGGLRNILPWVQPGPLLVHNGDIYTDIPLTQLIQHHKQSGLPVTLALRSEGAAKHIAINNLQSQVTDIRSMLGRADGTHVFSGVYCINREIIETLPIHEKISIIPTFLTLAEQGLLGAIVLDNGHWFDLGDRNAYLQAHQHLKLDQAIHPSASIHPTAIISQSVIGPKAKVGANAIVRNSVLWPHTEVGADASLDHCIVYSTDLIMGHHANEDL